MSRATGEVVSIHIVPEAEGAMRSIGTVHAVPGRGLVIDGARLGIRERIDERDPSAGREPSAGKLEEGAGSCPVDVAQPEPGEQGVRG